MDLPSTSRRQSDVATTTSASNHNIWDSAWNACTQVPPPNLTDVLGAYAQKGDGDREMLLNILKAKSAEDQRIAAVASLHQTILQLQAQAVSAHLANQPLLNGLSTPTPTPPMQSPPPPFQHRSYYPPPAHHHGGSPLHDSSTTPTPNYPNHQTPYASHPTLPPISTIQSACPPSQEPSRKRSRLKLIEPPLSGLPTKPLLDGLWAFPPSTAFHSAT
ncbi:hypothetical protein FRB99_007934 [Tulasnella sp. 403]|nr:hypothetical protein FRB99_007934 [Tulasnella sp. 403]